MAQLIKLSISDFKLVFRDGALRVFLFMPLLILGIILLFLPFLVGQYAAVNDYVLYVLMASTMQTSTMFGFIYSMVFIDEKDLQVSKVYGVLPVSKLGFVLSRLILPFVFAVVATFILLYFQPFMAIPVVHSFGIAVLAGLIAPIMALAVSILSKNKMEGMTWFKVANLFVTLPILAFFVPKISAFFYVFPTYWTFLWLENLESGVSPLFTAVFGFVLSLGLLMWLAMRFIKVHFS